MIDYRQSNPGSDINLRLGNALNTYNSLISHGTSSTVASPVTYNNAEEAERLLSRLLTTAGNTSGQAQDFNTIRNDLINRPYPDNTYGGLGSSGSQWTGGSIPPYTITDGSELDFYRPNYIPRPHVIDEPEIADVPSIEELLNAQLANGALRTQIEQLRRELELLREELKKLKEAGKAAEITSPSGRRKITI